MAEFMETIACYKCGVVWGMTSTYLKNRRADKDSFYCPNGHGQSYTKSEADRLKEQLAKQKQRTEQAERNAQWERDGRGLAEDAMEHAENRVRTYKGHVTRLKNRIAAGKCPVCHAEFHDLREHIEGEHPGYGEARNG